jgi:tetratricopeptide (TPR) repeat protein
MQREESEQAIRARVDALIKLAESHMQAGRWGEAKRVTDKARAADYKQQQKSAIDGLYSRLDAEGQRQLKEAEQLFAEKKYVEAVEAYELIYRMFRPLPAALAALEANKKAEADPAVRSAVQESKAATLNKLVENIISEVLKAAKDKVGAKPDPSGESNPVEPPNRIDLIKRLTIDKQAKVVTLLQRISSLYGESPTGKQAAADLKTVHSDKVLMAALAQHRLAKEARSIYGQAEAFRSAGLLEKALEGYEEVIEKFPESPEAKKAKDKIAELRSKVKPS